MTDATRRLTEIRRSAGGSRRRVTLYLDGEVWRTTTTGVLRDLGLKLDDEISPSAVDAQAHKLEIPEARERAFRLLGYRERSASELLARLEDDGYPKDVATDTVTALEQTGLVDDERFASLLARSLVTIRGYGRARAEREFARFGVAPDIVERALDDVAPREGEADRAVAAAQRLMRPSDTVDRVAARLVRRGFTPRTALDAARTTLSDIRDDSPLDD